MKKHLITLFSIGFLLLPFLFSEEHKSIIYSKSDVNWITRNFVTELSLDTVAANLQMPTGIKSAKTLMLHKMPPIIHSPLLSLYCDANQNIEDKIILEELSLDDVNNFINEGEVSTFVLSRDLKSYNTKKTLNLSEIGKYLVKHNAPYTPNIPINSVPSRPYTGIIIDARGANHVHGEYIESETYPCLFPTIWGDNMEKVYERNLVEPNVIKEKGLVGYHYSDDISLYEDRVGADPLYIKATEVYGRNRTDPIIKTKDALKILTIPENLDLMREGKVVILLDKENLIYKVTVPEKTPNYYVQYHDIKKHFYENKVPNVTVSDTINGILFSVDLNFYPDSPELLPTEKGRIQAIAESLKSLLMDDGYTILVEGHTADVGKPIGQLNLSIERTRTVMNALVDEGIDEKLFTYKGYGGTLPVATNETEEGRAQNRRVDITARPRATYIQRDW